MKIKMIFILIVATIILSCQEKNTPREFSKHRTSDLIYLEEVLSDTLIYYNNSSYLVRIHLLPSSDTNKYITTTSYDENGKYFMKYVENYLAITIIENGAQKIHKEITKENIEKIIDNQLIKNKIIHRCTYISISEEMVKLLITFCTPDTDDCWETKFTLNFNNELNFENNK